MCASGALPGVARFNGPAIAPTSESASGCKAGLPLRSTHTGSSELRVFFFGGLCEHDWYIRPEWHGCSRSRCDCKFIGRVDFRMDPGRRSTAGDSDRGRAALCVSLVAGKSLQEVHASNPALGATPPAKHQLDDELRNIAVNAIAASRPNFVAVIARPWTPTSQHVLRWRRPGDCEVVGRWPM